MRSSVKKAARTPGAYILLFRLPRCEDMTVGRLGTFDLASGHYAYVGSARGGLEARVGRHLRGGGKKHWHIDYLTERAVDLGAYVFPSGQDIECELAKMVAGLPGATMPIRRFGSSDCRCISHLFLLDGKAIEALSAKMSERGSKPLMADQR